MTLCVNFLKISSTPYMYYTGTQEKFEIFLHCLRKIQDLSCLGEAGAYIGLYMNLIQINRQFLIVTWSDNVVVVFRNGICHHTWKKM